MLNGTRPETVFEYDGLQATYYDAAGNLISGSPITRQVEISTCQTGARPACVGTADEVRTTTAYGASTNLLPASTTSSAGDDSLTATTSLGYDIVRNVTSVNGPLSGSTDMVSFRYDALRRRVGTISPDPDGSSGTLLRRAQRITWNEANLVTKVEVGTVAGTSAADWANFASLQAVETSWDSNDRAVMERLTAGGATHALSRTSYDSRGRPVCVARRMDPARFATPSADACQADTPAGTFGPDRITRTTYDAADQVTRIQTGYDVDGETADEMQIAWRDNGTVYHVTDGEQNRTTYFYDGHDRLWTTRFPMPDTPNTSNIDDNEQRTWDEAGNLVEFRNRSGHTAEFEYDRLDRLVKHDRYNTDSDIDYSYDLLGRMLSATQGASTIAFTWDALGRRLSKSGPLGTQYSEYDAAGRRTRLWYTQSGFNLVYDYLHTGEMTRVRVDGATNGVNVVATYGYDNLGRRTSLTRGNGVVTDYGYDSAGRLNSIAHDPVGTTHDLTLGFDYNHAGQIVVATRSDDSFAFTGHANASVANTHNGLNQIVATGGVEVDHNQRGDTIAIGSTDYVYSEENRLTSVEGGAAAGGVSLSYDPLGRLYQVSTPTSVRRFVYDGASLIGEYDGDGNYLHRYIHGAGIDEPVTWDDRTQAPTITRRHFHADERGSIVMTTNAADTAGHVEAYDEYGRPQGGTVATRFGYTGQAWLPELGMYDYRSRLYNPSLGRFMQPDVVGYDAGMNLYAYVGGDPVNLSDPSGMTPPPNEPPKPPACVGDACAMTGTRIPNGIGGLCGSCSGYSIQMGRLNFAAISRGRDIPWTFTGQATSAGLTGTVTFGGRLQGTQMGVGAGQMGALLGVSSWGSSDLASTFRLASAGQFTIGPAQRDADGYRLAAIGTIRPGVVNPNQEHFIGFWNSSIRVTTYTTSFFQGNNPYQLFPLPFGSIVVGLSACSECAIQRNLTVPVTTFNRETYPFEISSMVSTLTVRATVNTPRDTDYWIWVR